MKISVVTVCFNSGSTIGYALDSFFAQDHADKELLVIDGASRDDTLAIVGRYPGARVVSEPDRGIYDAMNKGLAAFTGDAVGFLNADDRYKHSGALSEIAARLAAVDIVHGNIDFVSDHASGRVTRRWRTTPFRPGAFARGWMPAHPSFYVRRDVVRQVGLFDLSYPIAGDYDYMLRAMELNRFRHAFIERPLVDMMQGGTSNAGVRAYIAANREALRSRRKWLASGLVDRAFFAKPLGKLGQFVGSGPGR
jgi:glycosyltransferase involved in cell wall biosynthesis